MAAGQLNGTFDPKKQLVSFGSASLTGFADGEFISWKRKEAKFKPVVGSSGEQSWDRSADDTVEFELVLMATSQDNNVLSAIHLTDIQTGAGLLPFMIKELNGLTVVHAAFARITQAPDGSRGKEQGKTTWKITTTSGDIFNAGINS